MPTPLYVKYQSSSGKHYIYDLGTGKIVETNEVVSKIIENFRIVSDEEIVELYREVFGETAVLDALNDLHELRAQNILKDHIPFVAERATHVSTNGELVEMSDYLTQHRHQLLLGVTERCNLRCDYCPYGAHYSRHRNHGEDDMAPEIAELAISEHIRNSATDPVVVSFYGGEPLLAFDLMKHCVEFAKTEAKKLGKQIQFNMTTNATLLTEEKIHFLVAEGFIIAISLDGPKASHDRYRVYQDKTNSGRRVGSFDIVMKNIRRFIELYPDYQNRGIFLTLAKPYDIEGTHKLVEELFPYFPNSRTSLVIEEYNETFGSEGIRPKQNGCVPSIPCSSEEKGCGSCGTGGCGTSGIGKSGSTNGSSELLPIIDAAGDGCSTGNCGSSSTPSSETERETEQIQQLVQDYLDSKIEFGQDATDASPVANMLFREIMFGIHMREINDDAKKRIVNYKCFPGNVRMFCDIRGTYFACEKCENTKTMSLGDVWNGMDVGRSENLLEIYRHVADCGNCVAQRHCTNCFTNFFENENQDGMLVGEAFDTKCRSMRQGTAMNMKMYTDIMEKNPDAFGKSWKVSDKLVDNDERIEDRANTKAGDCGEDEISAHINVMLPKETVNDDVGLEQLAEYFA